MCGINGILRFQEEPIENIHKMNREIHHRGPDDDQYYLIESDRVVLGHRRLSIRDLSVNGRQPMESHSGRFVIVYNGEIYNVAEVYDKMQQKFGQVPLKSTCDTEILVEAIERFGAFKTAELCKGMFGIAVYDKQEKTLQLIRDRMGEKPIYYGKIKDSFVFASDIASIKAISYFDNAINSEIIPTYLQHGYIPAPYSIYKDIFKLEPGTILTIKVPFAEWITEPYFSIADTAKYGQEHLFKGSYEEAKNELINLLLDSIKGQMLSDVPLGAFLSGGIDSTLVVSLMQSLSSNQVKTFTIGFEEDKYNEAVYAKETANVLGTTHTEMYVGYQDVMDLLPQLPKAFSEPFADSSQLPTMLVSKMTKQHVTVSLSGDAGDEFFCGYNSYKDVQSGLQILRSKAGFLPDGVRYGLGNALIKSKGFGLSALQKAGEIFTIQTPEDVYRSIQRGDVTTQKLVGNLLLPTKNSMYHDGYLTGAESNLMLMDMQQYLPDDILVKVDRAGMYYSLESRIPLLDRDVINFAWTLPDSYKYQNGITKRILRDIVYDYIPKEMMDRPKKGFSVPVSIWLKDGQMGEWAESIILDSEKYCREYINWKQFIKIWNHYKETGKWDSVIWHVLMFGQWIISQKFM